jgi:hypothetical protein
MKKTVHSALQHGQRVATTTYAIDYSDKGSTIAVNGTMTNLRYISPPTAQALRRPAFLTLQDDGTVPTMTIFNVDFSSYPLAWPSSNSSMSIYNNQLIADANIRFTNLTITNIPSGSQFEIDVA